MHQNNQHSTEEFSTDNLNLAAWLWHIGFVPRAVPARPIWTGFAVNTFFYAMLLWLIIPGPFAVRRLFRRRRGLCPACGYDLRHGEHEACPECGT